MENAGELINKLQYLNLKALWLNKNPVAEDQEMKEFVDRKTRIEIYNSVFTKNTTAWGIKYAHSRNLEYANTALNSQVYVLNLDGRNIFNSDIQVF